MKVIADDIIVQLMNKDENGAEEVYGSFKSWNDAYEWENKLRKRYPNRLVTARVMRNPELHPL